MKIVIKETYGGIKTYMNQIYLHEDFPEIENKKSISEIKKSFSTNNNKSYIKNKKNSLAEDRKENNNDDIINEENMKNVDTDSEDSLQNTPQHM